MVSYLYTGKYSVEEDTGGEDTGNHDTSRALVKGTMYISGHIKVLVVNKYSWRSR